MTGEKPIARISREYRRGREGGKAARGGGGGSEGIERRITGIIRVASDEQIISMVLHEATTVSKRVLDDPVARISRGKKGPAVKCVRRVQPSIPAPPLSPTASFARYPSPRPAKSTNCARSALPAAPRARILLSLLKYRARVEGRRLWSLPIDKRCLSERFCRHRMLTPLGQSAIPLSRETRCG